MESLLKPRELGPADFVKKGPLQSLKDKSSDLLFNQYTAQMAAGVGASVLTNYITPPPESEGVGAGIQHFDAKEGNAANYVSDISIKNIAQGGNPIKFDMFVLGTVPYYGPSNLRNLASNPYISRGAV